MIYLYIQTLSHYSYVRYIKPSTPFFLLLYASIDTCDGWGYLRTHAVYRTPHQVPSPYPRWLLYYQGTPGTRNPLPGNQEPTTRNQGTPTPGTHYQGPNVQGSIIKEPAFREPTTREPPLHEPPLQKPTTRNPLPPTQVEMSPDGRSFRGTLTAADGEG